MMIKFYFEQRPWALETALWIARDSASGERAIAKPIDLVFEKREFSVATEPTIVFKGPHALTILNELRASLEEMNLTPDKKKQEFEAIKYHLEDMRRLVFKE